MNPTSNLWDLFLYRSTKRRISLPRWVFPFFRPVYELHRELHQNRTVAVLLSRILKLNISCLCFGRLIVEVPHAQKLFYCCLPQSSQEQTLFLYQSVGPVNWTRVLPTYFYIRAV